MQDCMGKLARADAGSSGKLRLRAVDGNRCAPQVVDVDLPVMIHHKLPKWATDWAGESQSVAHLGNLWWIMTGRSTSTTCGAHLFPSTARNRSLPEEPASARASLPMQSCMLQRTSMSRFVNDEGHEGTRSKMLLRLIDGLLSCVALSVVLSVIAPQPALAGGPRYVAGVSYFDPTTKGTPLTWSQGIINYYTDQGDLSPILLGANADSFVADAFSRWTAVPTAAGSSTLAGHLAEDVNGTKVSVTNGVVTMPADILPTAVSTPVGIVYDADGSVTSALLLQGG